MANTLRIKRRASGSVGAPASLVNAELAFNEMDDTLYYGKGNSGGNATSVIAIGGAGSFVTLSGASTFSGTKTLAGAVDFTGTVTAPTQATSDNSTKVATTAFVKSLGLGSGTVSSVALSLPNIFSVSGSPVTSSGTLTASLSLQAAATVFAAPDNTSGQPSFRALVSTDIPTLTAAKISDFTTQVRANRLSEFSAPVTAVSFNGQKITGLADPTAAQDAATKAYVDAVKTGLDIKDSVRVATTTNITLSGTQTIDGVALVAGDRVLVKNQSTASQNGIYVVAAGAWARASDADAAAEVHGGMFFFVTEGNTFADSGWVLTTNEPITLGTTDLAFTQFSGAGSITDGDGISKSGNTISVAPGVGMTVSKAGGVALTGQALALHNLASNGMVARTGSGTVAARSVAASGSGISVSNGDGVAGNPTVSLSSSMAAIAGVTAAADTIAYWTSASAAAAATLTTFARSLLDDVDAAAARTTLGLGSIATQAANSVAITGGSIDNITLDGGTF